ncbi:MAG TPA: ABC transporter permease [Thermoanaerobaculia bacterium]|nr:ABC transporter permease [Thermoanaerobaculia bacterium]
MWSPWIADFRHAARALRRRPGFTLMAVGTLALALGANAGMFGVVNTVLVKPLPYPQPGRLVHIAGTAPGSDLAEEFGVAPEFYLEYREQSHLLKDVAIYNSFTSTLRVGDRVERIRMSAPTNSLYSTLGAQPALGRLPVAADESHVVMISDELWRAWFGADPKVIGKTYSIAGESREVIGVMGPDFRFPNNGTLLWIASEVRPAEITPGDFGVRLVGRMAAGATPETVAHELTLLARRLPERFGGSPSYARIIQQHHAVVRPLLDEMLGSAAKSLWVLLAAVAFVLLIACANITNLFMVRAEGRRRDLAIRRAVGASRRQLIRLQLTESLIVATLAGALAILLASLALPLFLRAAPRIPRLDEVRLDGATILFTAVAALLSGLACGLIPALRASVTGHLTPLRDGGRGATPGRHWLRDGLVVGQTALALLLLIGSGLLVRSFQALRQVDPGYDTRDVFTFQFAPEQEPLKDGPSWARFHLDFMQRLRAVPGVTSVGLVENVPLNEGTADDRFRNEAMASDPDAGILLNYTFTAGDYFRTMGIQLLQGRPFDTADQLTTPGNVVVSRSAAQLMWPGQNAIGRRLQAREETTWYTVVGVVDDVMQDGFRDTPQALVYLPLVGPTPTSWDISSPAYVLKTARAEVIAPEIRELIREVAPEAPMYRVFTMAGLAADSMAQLSFTMLTLGVLSTLALLLGAIGLYGVLSYAVAERTREIGVRLALGATVANVRRMVVAQGARVVGLGLVLGLAAAAVSSRIVASLLFGVAAMDPATFGGMSALMAGVGLLACFLPARRASSVDPVESLRNG